MPRWPMHGAMHSACCCWHTTPLDPSLPPTQTRLSSSSHSMMTSSQAHSSATPTLVGTHLAPSLVLAFIQTDMLVLFVLVFCTSDELVVLSKGNVSNPIPSIVGYVPGAVNPQGNHNPSMYHCLLCCRVSCCSPLSSLTSPYTGFRIYDVDSVTGEVLTCVL